jgi:hypothetical protein
MGAVIKFPLGRRLRGRPATAPDASAAVIILPAIRIERAPEARSPVKARIDKPAAAKSVAAKSAAARSVKKSAVKAAPARKRRKRAAP